MTTKTVNGKRYIRPWNVVNIELPFSEVNMHMRVAGERKNVMLVGGEHPMAQILTEDFEPFSAPITTGEAGIFHDQDGYYTYEP